MPIRGLGKQLARQAPYFVSLSELDAWPSTAPRLNGVLNLYNPKSLPESQSRRGKLLVCHDYKGGYKDDPVKLSYTFNFWPTCEIFVYFSHHCVTIPPPGWITAAHRQGVSILGTLIFEPGAEKEVLRLIVGKLPSSKSAPAIPSPAPGLPMSPHYARLLADLALQRGFDGYLLNFECTLGGGPEQARALAAWISVLRAELILKVGPHAHVIWYDSVIYTGQLSWQDRLNRYNLPFFVPSSGFFTNYTWQGHYPSLTAQYFTSLDPSLFSANSRTLNDIYTGIDVWGRGSYGGGGFGSYRALTRIDPEFLGLSAALFGQGWTWESEEGKPGWTWEKWWEYDRKLWFGPANPDEKVEVPDMPDGGDDAPYDPGPFRPLTTFFERRAPPNPVDLPLHVSFGMGVGHAWFINGMKVFQTDQGWTDVDKQTSLGDMLWPRPTVTHEGEITGDPLPCASSAIDMEDAWNGGSSLRITFCGRKVEDGDVCFQCLWVPIQSLAISPRQSYDATLIYKLPPNDLAAVDIGFSVRPSLSSSGDVSTSVVDETGLPGGWTKLSMQFQLLTDHIYDVASTLGLIVGIATEDRADFSILLGQINVFPSVPSPNTTSPAQARIMWVDLQPLPPSTVTTGPLAYLPGDLVWDVGATFPPIALGRLGDPEDPIPVWRLDTSERCFPAMLYFNVYFEWRGRADCERGVPMHPDRAVFIGTTGLDGQANRFYVDPKALPEFGRDAITFRFYVQGVTDRGEVLPWEQCAFVEVGEDDRRRDYNNETLVLQNM